MTNICLTESATDANIGEAGRLVESRFRGYYAIHYFGDTLSILDLPKENNDLLENV